MKSKNKKAEQAAKRKKHLAELRRAKRRKRGQAPTLERQAPQKRIKQKILIVCEGKNTEPSYFNQFKLSTATIKSVGEGYNTLTLVDRAVELAARDDYDQVWCVFDKDDFPNENFNNAIFKAENLGFKVAYSNQAFEYWLILHFEDHQGGAMHRSQYAAKLNQYLAAYGITYDRDSKEVSEAFFEVLRSKNAGTERYRQEVAIKRAARNLQRFDGKNPAREESSTRVHLLVKEMERYR